MILIDADDVCCKTNIAWLAEINKRYSKNYLPEQATSWHLHECLNLTTEIYEIVDSGDFHLNLELMDDSYRVLNKLWKRYRCRIVTAAMQNGHIMDAKINWFKNKLPFIDSRHLIFAKDKSVVGGPFDYLIDDAIHNHIDHPASSIVFDQPWNRHWNEREKEDSIRVKSWKEIEKIFGLENV